MPRHMSEPNTKTKPARIALVPTNLVLSVEDRQALQREALRRHLAGEANRINISAIVRGLIADWRAAR